MERGNQYLKLIDRYAGIPLLWILGQFQTHNRNLPSDIKRIAIIKGAAIGDTVLLSAIVQDIRAQFPTVELLFFCGKTCFDTAKQIPGINQVVLIETTKPIKSIQTLRSAGCFDIVIDAGPWTRLEALLAYFTNGLFKIGFHSLYQYRHYGYDLAVEHSDKQHELENNRNLIRSFVTAPTHMPTLVPPSINFKKIQDELGLSNSFWILHAWSGGFKGHYKEWVNERWVGIAADLSAQGYQVLFSGTKADSFKTAGLVDDCLQRGIPAVNLAGQTSLSEMMAILKMSKGVISVNTGIMHIAASLGVPVVCLNGPVPSLRWGALSTEAINIDAKGSECGYIHLGFEYPKDVPDCMGSITIHDVQTAIKKIIEADYTNNDVEKK
ncbi:glycosyltransferase family 9 protein [Fibrella arboris]|uniref:glycosyltransferase family 9 protein n=1 Tax=Fibrella arboris TaxID=3242486 RepID=UPI003521E8E3